MTRNTHDLNLDHHGTFGTNAVFTDQGSDPSAPASGTHVLYSKAGGVYVEDPTGAVSGPIGAGGATALITGDSSNFSATIGSWTVSGTGATATWDNVFIKFLSNSGSLHFHAPQHNEYVELAVPGVFKQGVEYQAVIAIANDLASSPTLHGLSYYFYFGDIASGDMQSVSAGTWTRFVQNEYGVLSVRWTPTADRTAVKLRFLNWGNYNGTGFDAIPVEWHIGWAQVAVVADSATKLGLQMALDENTQSIIVPQSTAIGVNAVTGGIKAGLLLYDNSVTLQTNASGINLSDTAYAYFGGVSTTGTGDLLSSGHFDLEVGPDYVGLYISEKDNRTIQIYPDYLANGYDVELHDVGTGRWYSVSADGKSKVALNTHSEPLTDGSSNFFFMNGDVIVLEGVPN